MAMPAEAAAAAAASWVVDLEGALGNVESCAAASAARWTAASSYRVPPWVRDHNAPDYTPRLVSFGPIHHGRDCLMPMEEHKRRALDHFLGRANKPMAELAAAVEEMAAELMDSYEGLDERWRRNKGAFLKVMIVDGCFMLEVFLCAGRQPSSRSYGEDDPVFGSKGRAYMMPCIRRDMLLIENQLPLLLLDRLAHCAFREQPNYIHELVLGFFGDTVLVYSKRRVPRDHAFQRCMFRFCQIDLSGQLESYNRPAGCLNDSPLGLHVLDVYRKSMLLAGDFSGGFSIYTASGLSVHGVIFRGDGDGSFRGITFHARSGCLHLPLVLVEDDSVPIFLNLVAFEKLHHGAGNEVNNYLVLMGSLLDSAEDVRILNGFGIISFSWAMNNESVFQVFQKICKEATLVVEGDEDPPRIESDVRAYCTRVDAGIIYACRVSRLTPGATMVLAILAFCVSLYAAFKPN